MTGTIILDGDAFGTMRGCHYERQRTVEKMRTYLEEHDTLYCAGGQEVFAVRGRSYGIGGVLYNQGSPCSQDKGSRWIMNLPGSCKPQPSVVGGKDGMMGVDSRQDDLIRRKMVLGDLAQWCSEVAHRFIVHHASFRLPFSVEKRSRPPPRWERRRGAAPVFVKHSMFSQFTRTVDV